MSFSSQHGRLLSNGAQCCGQLLGAHFVPVHSLRLHSYPFGFAGVSNHCAGLQSETVIHRAVLTRALDDGELHPGPLEIVYADFQSATRCDILLYNIQLSFPALHASALSKSPSLDFWKPRQLHACIPENRAMQALEEYKILLQKPDPDILQGACLIACHRHPGLLENMNEVSDILDDLAEQVIPTLPSSRYPLKIVAAISDYLYSNRGFRGNSQTFYDPENSCINSVLDRRTGIPITLSLVYMEVAKRCGLELFGVNIPGHFLLTPADPELEFFIDAFDGGSVAFVQDAEQTLERIYGQRVKLDSAFLRRREQIPARTFLTRILNNLKTIYAARKDYAAAYSVSSYLRATRPGDLEEVKDFGYILFHLQRYAECAVALREYLERAPVDAKDVSKVRRLVRMLRDVDAGLDDA